jgi:hypothetical protein
MGQESYKEPWKQNKKQRYSSRYLMYMCILLIYLSLSGFLSGIFGLAEKSLSAMSEQISLFST